MTQRKGSSWQQNKQPDNAITAGGRQNQSGRTNQGQKQTGMNLKPADEQQQKKHGDKLRSSQRQ